MKKNVILMSISSLLLSLGGIVLFFFAYIGKFSLIVDVLKEGFNVYQNNLLLLVIPCIVLIILLISILLSIVKKAGCLFQPGLLAVLAGVVLTLFVGLNISTTYTLAVNSRENLLNLAGLMISTIALTLASVLICQRLILLNAQRELLLAPQPKKEVASQKEEVKEIVIQPAKVEVKESVVEEAEVEEEVVVEEDEVKENEKPAAKEDTSIKEDVIMAVKKESKPVAKKETKAKEKAPVAKPAKVEAKKEAAPKKAEVKPVEKKQEDQGEQKKVYHIVKRQEDNKWTVKFRGGKKVIKLFNTKKEAEEYVAVMAENQGATALVHNSKGKNKGRISGSL